jgi:predicted phosphodiesterase
VTGFLPAAVILKYTSAPVAVNFCPMPNIRTRFLLLLLGVATLLHAHPDKVENQLLFHFATGTHPIEGGKWPDLTHRLEAKVIGAPVMTNIGPVLALKFDGFHDWLEAAPSLEKALPVLPTNQFSVAAWVLLDETHRDGGICGFIDDKGSREKGWLLGYNRKSFSFSLATKGADDGDGLLTKLGGSKPIETGRWHHVAATYDGKKMRLYVDGEADGESDRQSGDVLYPEQSRLAIAAYVDQDEFFPMQGSLFEVKTYARVMSAEEIRDVAERNKSLLAWRAPVNKNLQFVVKPYLQFGTSDGMTVMCETTQPSFMTVEYAERQPLTNRVVASEAKNINEVRINGLKGFTTYFYRVTCIDAAGNLAISDIASFQTAPPESAPWAFGILGDTQRNPEVTRRCAEGIFALRPNLMIHCGDVVDDGFAKQQWVYDLFDPCSRLFAHVPSFPVIGNHEKNSHWYYDYFSLPKPEYFYKFTYGNAEFFMIDSNKDLSPGSEQYKWLDKAMGESKAVWKFAAHHHPCFSSDEDDYGDRWKGRPEEKFVNGDDDAQKLVPLYEKHGLDIAFAGHIHSYERTWPILQLAVNQKKGVRYIVSGGGGGGLEQAAPQRAWFTLHVQRGHHYCFAVVQDRTIQFKAYDIEGRLFDTFELTKPADR